MTYESPYAPLPGTERPVRGLFIDRWGTLLRETARTGSGFDPEAYLPGGVDALFRSQQAGWSIYLIGNEDAVARGKLSDASWQRYEEGLLAHLRGAGVNVVRSYACLDHPQGKPPHDKPSVFRLPDTGLLFHAAQTDGITLRQSWVIGDSTLELAAGGRGGCNTIGVLTGQACRDGALDVEADVLAADLPAALELLIAASSRL